MGTPSFAVPSLRALHRLADVVGVYTRPDAVSGRGADLRSSPVAEYARSHGLSLLQPPTLRDDEAIERLNELAPELIVVAAFGLILPREVLEIPVHGCVNIHASLLPRWRGAAPVQRAILAGDERTGVCLMRMEEGLDTGPFCACASTAVDRKNSQELTDELALMGAGLITAHLSGLVSGSCTWTPQDPSLVTYAEKVSKSDIALHPALSADAAERRVRASGPSSPCRLRLGDKGLTVLDAEVVAIDVEPGRTRVYGGTIAIGLSDGALVLRRVKPDGRSEMPADAWMRGLRDIPSAWEAA